MQLLLRVYRGPHGQGATGDGCGGVKGSGWDLSCAFGTVWVQIPLEVPAFHLRSKNNSLDGGSTCSGILGTVLSHKKRLRAGKCSFASGLPPADSFDWSESSRGVGGVPSK